MIHAKDRIPHFGHNPRHGVAGPPPPTHQRPMFPLCLPGLGPSFSGVSGCLDLLTCSLTRLSVAHAAATEHAEQEAIRTPCPGTR